MQIVNHFLLVSGKVPSKHVWTSEVFIFLHAVVNLFLDSLIKYKMTETCS